jgi:hypothetical protein
VHFIQYARYKEKQQNLTFLLAISVLQSLSFDRLQVKNSSKKIDIYQQEKLVQTIYVFRFVFMLSFFSVLFSVYILMFSLLPYFPLPKPLPISCRVAIFIMNARNGNKS